MGSGRLDRVGSPFISYAQNGEDIVIARVLAGVDHGFYVDVGAADPIGYSATYALYRMGWSGINIEPVPRFADALKAVRPRDITIQSAAGDRPGEIELHVSDGTGLSTGIETQADRLNFLGFQTEPLVVPVRRLDDILREHRSPDLPIHVLKVDVEGMEYSVLNGVDFALWRPWLCVVEATEPLSQTLSHQEWEHLLIDHGYNFHLFDGLNRYYLADEHHDLGHHLANGVSIFDQPYQRAEVSLAIERHRESTIDQLQQAQLTIADLERDLVEVRTQLDTVTPDVIENETQLSELRLACDRLVEQLQFVTAQRNASWTHSLDLAGRLERGNVSEQERIRLQRQLDDLVASPTWRVGTRVASIGHRSGLIAVFRALRRWI